MLQIRQRRAHLMKRRERKSQRLRWMSEAIQSSQKPELRA
jgi:hypothetical protein